jgi:hypothetical protein
MIDNGCSLGCSSISVNNYCATHPESCGIDTNNNSSGNNNNNNGNSKTNNCSNDHFCATHPQSCGLPATTPVKRGANKSGCNAAELVAGAGLLVIVDVTVVAIPLVILVFVNPVAIAPYLEATEWLYIPGNATGIALIIHSGCVGE